jgi:selenide, water dikinase
MPGGTQRNWESYGHKISPVTEEQKVILADPQTSGGLLISVDSDQAQEFENFAREKGHNLKPFGKLVPNQKFVINVN